MLDYLSEYKKISVAEAMQLLDISESTVRRLFIRLEENGKVIRNHGGIQQLPDTFLDYSYEASAQQYSEQKRSIAQKAIELVESEDILFLDSGTTVAQFSLALAQRIESGLLHDISVFTNSLINLNHLNKFAKVSIIGGNYRDYRKDFCGYIAEETLKNLYFTKCFLGADGYSAESGFTSKEFNTARINELVLTNSKKRYILIDASKFNSTAIVSYSKNLRVDAVVVDTIPESHITTRLQGQNITVIHA